MHLPIHRMCPYNVGQDQVLMQWLPDLCFVNIGMAPVAINTTNSEIGDLEKGITASATHAVRAIVRPPPAVRKEEEVFSNESFTSSTSTLTADKFLALGDAELPRKTHGQLHRNLRYTLFSVYRRLNILVMAANIIVIIVLGAKGHLTSMSDQAIGTAAAANILVAVLVRQELVINFLFASFGKCPRWMPLRVRRLAAKIYHLGGVHSGAGMAATIWFGVFNYPIINSSNKNTSRDLKAAILAATIVLDVLLVSIVAFSHPGLRSRFHNTWEGIHRFAGWSAVGLFWAHIVLSTEAQRRSTVPFKPIGESLMKNPIFWCIFAVTVALILPWLRLRRVSVRAEPLSSHAVRLHFGYTNVPLCAAPRFSDSPLREWHAFAGIPEHDGVGFSILVSRAGDWTAKMIDFPPKQLWTKGIPARGVLHVAPIFRKLVLVATGSGIGPILSLLSARNLDARIIWSTPDPVATYSKGIVEQVRLADPDAIIINTTAIGRPNLVLETYKLYLASKAEAVFIISNPKVTRKVVYGLESRGIPVFAPIFDS
ncbi:hypothetical protein H2198_007573 [Neophaeococcomyces mojaviensis]|uniref:Uncharacterized protein n=2 Tax=Neophaeococcomyces mojaviensis TaxID=3383035 RepID=A0ACC2ZZP3_9EURO|nr:hypothetical protein H2198_009384 [Knufia sp. JES_112]KAJ9653215.1 hypothetical protein H2198_007573 [Knufia sp. JES_112]